MPETTPGMGRAHRRSLFVCIATTAVLTAGAFHPAAAVTTTYLSGQASPSGFPVGAWIYDSVNLGNGLNPTGTITFRLHGPTDPTCSAAPIFQTTAEVKGNGYYASPTYQANVAGTYRWRAGYSGDAQNSPTAPTQCGLASAAVTVAKRVASLSGRATLVAPSGPTSVTASLSGGGPSGPTGTMTFTMYGPSDPTCAGAAAFVTTRDVAGNGSYTSATYAPSVPGTYQWVLRYSGDANNQMAATICADPANAVSITATAATTLKLTLSPTTAAPGTNVTVSWTGIATPTSTDWMGLYAVGAADSAARSWRYTTGAASGSVPLAVPSGTLPGSYEIRLYANNSATRLATTALAVS